MISLGGSVIISPNGEVLAGLLYDKEGLLTGEVDPGEIVRSRMDFDVIGHYSRDDIFSLLIKDMPDMVRDR